MDFEEYFIGEVDTIFKNANAKMIDDTKTVGELLWGFEDDIFVQAKLCNLQLRLYV